MADRRAERDKMADQMKKDMKEKYAHLGEADTHAHAAERTSGLSVTSLVSGVILSFSMFMFMFMNKCIYWEEDTHAHAASRTSGLSVTGLVSGVI